MHLWAGCFFLPDGYANGNPINFKGDKVMLRKIRRNFARLFLRPFWRHKQKVEWQPPTTIPRLDKRIRPPTLSEVVDNYYNGNGPLGILKPVLRNLEDWHGLLPAGGRHATHDVIALMVGTPSQLLTHFHDFITQQNPDTNSVAMLLGGTVTPGDEEALYQRELAQPYWVRTSERVDTVGVYLDTLQRIAYSAGLLARSPVVAGTEVISG
jgi:hypothetical protein